MEKLKQYVLNTIGKDLVLEPLPGKLTGKLPYYINDAYHFFKTRLFDRELVLADAQNEIELTPTRIEKNIQIIKEITGAEVVLVFQNLPSYIKVRLIAKRINFIVPGKQMHLPAFLIDLNEKFNETKPVTSGLLPSAQCILLYNILYRNEALQKMTLKQLAGKFNYSAMGITKAADNLKNLNLCEIEGTKEKFIHFIEDIPELWNKALPLLTSPVIKKVFVEQIPENYQFYKSNESALVEYSDLNESRQQYIAIDKASFFNLQKSGEFLNLNDFEGNYCLEIWKYNPGILAIRTDKTNLVDPLSLYLSLKGIEDERIQAALDNIIKRYKW